MRIETGDRIKCDDIKDAARMKTGFAENGLLTKIVEDGGIWLEVVGEMD